MQPKTPTAWPVIRRMPDLAELDEPTRIAVIAAVARLRTLRDVFADRFLTVVRPHVASYAALSDDDIRDSARRFMDVFVAELSSLRIPDDALRGMLEDHALEHAARNIPLDDVALGYKLGSREMLFLLDEVAAEVALPAGFLLAAHDSTWEFANEAAAVFARLQHDLTLRRAHFDAERRSAFAAGVLGGTLPAERLNREAPAFGLTPQARYVALAAHAGSGDASEEADAVRRAVASAVRVPVDRLLAAQIGSVLGFIVSRAPESVDGPLVAVGPPLPLGQLGAGFEEAMLTLETARRFAMSGVVHLADLGPRPLVLSDAVTAEGLAARHLMALDTAGRSSAEIEKTVRVYLDCDQDVREVARRLAVHPNTVRYRVNRFQQLTALDLRRTEDLVVSWWLLNRRRSQAAAPAQPLLEPRESPEMNCFWSRT